MHPWLPIAITASHIVGRHPRYARLVVVRFELDRRPPTRWVDLFNRVDTGSLGLPGTPVPRVLDGLVQVDARDEALDDDVAGVLLHLEATNLWYEEDLRGAMQPPPPDGEESARLREARVRAARLTRDFGRVRAPSSDVWAVPLQFMPTTPSDREL